MIAQTTYPKLESIKNSLRQQGAEGISTNNFALQALINSNAILKEEPLAEYEDSNFAREFSQFAREFSQFAREFSQFARSDDGGE